MKELHSQNASQIFKATIFLSGLVLGIFYILYIFSIKSTKLDPIEVYGANLSSEFVDIKAFTAEKGKYLQAIHPLSNSKISMIISDEFKSKAVSSIKDPLETLKSGTNEIISPLLTKYFKAYLDFKRVDISTNTDLEIGSNLIHTNSFKHKKDEYFQIAIIDTPKGQIGILGFRIGKSFDSDIFKKFLEGIPDLKKTIN